MAKNQYPKRPPPPTRVDLEPAEFNAIIDDFGTIIRITPSAICPRRSGNEIENADANHDLNCPLCGGSMVIDFEERAWEAAAYMQAVKLDKVFDPSGRFDIKDALVTFKSQDRVSYWYRLEMIDFQSLYNEVVLRREGDDDRLRYKGLEPQDGTYYLLTDGEGVRYARGVDYTVAGNVLSWIGARPSSGKLYSLVYPVLPTFRVLELLHETRHYYYGFRKPTKEPVQLPQQAHVRWDFMIKGRGNDVLVEKGS